MAIPSIRCPMGHLVNPISIKGKKYAWFVMKVNWMLFVYSAHPHREQGIVPTSMPTLRHSQACVGQQCSWTSVGEPQSF